ncbi:hypothetical protein TNCV_4309121 [Trichonephila clavipes]|nr:hypothetical protein TNCV_4309121 [Trichonephila clavipes]
MDHVPLVRHPWYIFSKFRTSFEMPSILRSFTNQSLSSNLPFKIGKYPVTASEKIFNLCSKLQQLKEYPQDANGRTLSLDGFSVHRLPLHDDSLMASRRKT